MKRDQTMTDTITTIMRRHVEAITHMLLADRVMKPGLAITAGQILDPAGIWRIEQLARESNNDLIHLDFEIRGETVTLRDIIIAAPRDFQSFVYTGCRLAQRRGDRRAVILPRAGGRGHFRVQPREIVHIKSQPDSLMTSGVAFAAERLAALVSRGAKVDGQIVVHEVGEWDGASPATA